MLSFMTQAVMDHPVDDTISIWFGMGRSLGILAVSFSATMRTRSMRPSNWQERLENVPICKVDAVPSMFATNAVKSSNELWSKHPRVAGCSLE